MSHDDRASDFEVSRFQKRKQELYKCLDEEKLEDIKYSKVKRKGDHLKHNALRDVILPLLNPVVNQLELHTAYYSCGNGEIIIDSGFKNSDDVIKKIFIVLIRSKQIVLYFFYVDLSWCRFDVSDNDHSKIIMWFETVGKIRCSIILVIATSLNTMNVMNIKLMILMNTRLLTMACLLNFQLMTRIFLRKYHKIRSRIIKHRVRTKVEMV